MSTPTIDLPATPSQSVVDRTLALSAAAASIGTAGISADFDDLLDLADWLLVQELDQVIADLAAGEPDDCTNCDCWDDGAIPHTVESLLDAEFGRRVIDKDDDVWTKVGTGLGGWTAPGVSGIVTSAELLSYGPIYDYDEGVDDRVPAEDEPVFVLDFAGLDALPVGSIIRNESGHDYVIVQGATTKAVRALYGSATSYGVAVFAEFYQGRPLEVRFIND